MSSTGHNEQRLLRREKLTALDRLPPWCPGSVELGDELPVEAPAPPRARRSEPVDLAPPVALASSAAQLAVSGAALAAAAEQRVAEALEAERARHAAELARLAATHTAELERQRAELARQRGLVRRTIASLRTAIADLAAARAEAALEVEARAVELALEVATRAAGEAVRARRHDIEGLVGRLLDEARRRFAGAPIALHLAPGEAAHVEACGIDLNAVTVVADAELPEGEARVRCPDGELWDGVRTRLDALAAAILGDAPPPLRLEPREEARHAA